MDDQQSGAARQPTINIVGEKVALGPLRRDLVPLYEKWINDFEVTRNMGVLRPLTTAQEESWYEQMSKSDDAVFTIYERNPKSDGLRPIGSTGLHRIDLHNRIAEFGIMIGEKESWGKGYGTETATLMLDYGFTALGLHNIWLRVYSYNPRGVRAYLRAGFREAGRLREARRLGGKPYDVIYMDSLATEFVSPVLRKLMP